MLHEPYKTEFEDKSVPEIEDPNDVIVEVKYTGICGSDVWKFKLSLFMHPLLTLAQVHYWTDGKIGAFELKKPMVLGHESSGIVYAAGSEASRTHRKGDLVAMEPQIPCRRCDRCRTGQYNLCPDIRFAATPPIDGTLARYYRLPVDFCHKLPDGMKLEHGALCEPASVAVHACSEAGVGIGSKVVVFGAGPVGLLACGVAKAMGASKIVAVDVVDERLEFAKKYAGVATFKSHKSESVEDSAVRLIKECGLGEGADAVLEATGAEPCIRIGCNVVRGKGTFCQIGLVSLRCNRSQCDTHC